MYLKAGDIFNYWTAIEDSIKCTQKSNFKCQCGTIKSLDPRPVKSGKTKSCGCQTKRTGADSPFWKGGKFVPSRFLSSFKAGAESRNLEWNLTLQDLDRLWESQLACCAYSGIPLVFGQTNLEQTASLDRIDSSKGYFLNNVQFVHKVINQMKWNLKEEVFLDFCNKVKDLTLDKNIPWEQDARNPFYFDWEDA